MAPPKPWIPGDPITAERLNETAAESIRPRREISLGNGSSFVNETMGNQSANMRRPFMKLVEAIEDFEIPYEPTDLDVALDDVPSGMVRQVRLNKRSGEHNKETIGGPFRAWDVLQGLNYQSSKSTGDKFYVLYNEDSKRWEVLGQAVGGSRRIWFTIVSVECVGYTGEMILTVDPTWYTGGCDVPIPGEDGYGYLLVEDVCETLAFYIPEELVGATGSATYMFPRTGVCEAKWLVDDICVVPECA